jgi:predicted PurR-regulated permease PerM
MWAVAASPMSSRRPALSATASDAATPTIKLITRLLESYVITPLIDRRTASVPPALVIVAQLLFGLLFGALGLMFATPIVAAGMVLGRQLWIEEELGEDTR